MLFVITLSPQTANGETAFEDACQKVREQIASERETLDQIQTSVSAERRSLRRALSSIQSTNRELTAQKSALESASDDIRDSIDVLNQTLFENKTKLTRMRDSLHFNFSEFYQIYGQIFKDRMELRRQIDRLKSKDETIELDNALNIGFGAYLEYFQQASTIESGNAELYDESGKLVQGDLLRTGLVGGAFWNKEKAGVMHRRRGSDHMNLLAKNLTAAQRGALAVGANQKSNMAPVLLDISDGIAIRKLESKKDWKSFFDAGGFVMYPLAAIGVLAFLMIIERVLLFSRFTVSLGSMRKKILGKLEVGDFRNAAQVADDHRGPTRRFWQKAVALLGSGSKQKDEALQHLIISELPIIERFLSSLAVFAAICPLLGLLGTVSGMIHTFEIITLYGTGNSALLSQGISEALVTTQVGLILAIPILLAHSSLSRKAKSILANMDEITGIITKAIDSQKIS